MINLDKLNKEQKEAATHIHGPMLVLAGAGTGKTATMTYRAAHLIDKGISPERILMLTFTNKAAKEMKERLIGLLNEDEGKKVTACTFHSFCALMLRIHGHHIGISQHFTILSPGDAEDIIAIVKSVMENSGRAIIGIGIGMGEDRAIEAAKQAVNSPLLETSINGATDAIDTIKDLADALSTHEDAYDALLETVGKKAEKTYVDEELAKKVNISDYNTDKNGLDKRLAEVEAQLGGGSGTGSVTDILAEHEVRIGDIEEDYLTSEDKTELEGKITTAQNAADAAQAKTDAAAAVAGQVKRAEDSGCTIDAVSVVMPGPFNYKEGVFLMKHFSFLQYSQQLV